MNRNNVVAVSIAIAVGATMWVAISAMWVEKALTEIPPRVGMEPMAVTALSNVSVPIRLDVEALSELANELIPLSFDIPNQTVFHDDAWTKNPLNGKKIPIWSITINGAGHVRRTSPVTVTADKDGLVLAATAHASFTARKGHVHETANADVSVKARIVLDASGNWEPIVRVTPSYAWINRPVARLFNLFDLSLGTITETILNSQIAKLQAELPGFVRKTLPLEVLMASAWSQAHTAMRLSQAPEAWIAFDPVSAHMLPPTAVGNDLLLNVGLVARMTLSMAAPDVPVAEPLPMLNKVAPDDPEFRIGLPIRASYEALGLALSSAIKDRPIKVQTPVGEAVVHVSEATIYPSAPRLVVGAKVDVDLPDRWLDTTGWVYFFAEPSFDVGKKSLQLKNLHFARMVDNSLVRVLTVAFAGQIEGEIAELSSIDLSKPLDDAVQKANTFLGKELQDRVRAETLEANAPLGALLARTEVIASVDGLSSVSFALEDRQLTLMPVVAGSLAVELLPKFKPSETTLALE